MWLCACAWTELLGVRRGLGSARASDMAGMAGRPSRQLGVGMMASVCLCAYACVCVCVFFLCVCVFCVCVCVLCVCFVCVCLCVCVCFVCLFACVFVASFDSWLLVLGGLRAEIS